MINHKKPIPSNKRFEIAGRGTAETAIQKFYDYITKKQPNYLQFVRECIYLLP
ncbi:hypothetical protein PRABACTJOHN_00959 [Parabacteroides johnsonii DSM 18315]|uniref:Uncharacterized protein n=1 Tax=Parabacteroides johnsonii DSM 18315 TaxID=537006 RepID=B7B7G1_9BACT|nr:hypothetical protein PRABACTJOHN_00959 [Parabacteroides johnsonii DSM 18315]DAY51137.1 MAG TPA: hypothetical protein [Caudoviricetes sp.]